MTLVLSIGNVNLQLPKEFIVTLKKFHEEQKLLNGEQTVSLRTLQEQAEAGELPGAYKVGSRWWMNKLAAAVNGLQSNHEEESTKPQTQGNGNRPPSGPKIPRPDSEEGPERLFYTPR
jgi:hypothetical protein